MTCIIDELKDIRKTYRKKIIDEIDVIKLLNKLINHKCCKECLLRKELTKISN